MARRVNGVSLVDDLDPELEERYLVAPDEARGFLARVEREIPADVFDPARPISFVRTTYFDTDDLELFRSQRRRRVRLREYAGSPGPDSIPTLTGDCAFELKEGSDRARHKARMVGDRVDLMRLLRRGPHRPIDPDLARAAADVRCGHLRPRLTTFFRRRSYTGDGIRITLDELLVFARPVRLGRAGEPAEPGEVIGRGPPLVLEVKLAGPRPAWLDEAAHDFLLMTRFSKFKGGMLALARADQIMMEAHGVIRCDPASVSRGDRSVRGPAPSRRASMATWLGLAHDPAGTNPFDSGRDR
jgi:hypothetical protein